MISPSLPAGFRDTSPQVFAERKYIASTLETIFIRHGFVPLETPAMEHLSTLLGKYGTEGDRLIFKVLNSGDFLASVDRNIGEGSSQALAQKICKRGLRYDLTLPLARYVAQHRHTLHLPFKRYQIDRVWRADRPQQGRYREFYQCDIDVVDASSHFHDAMLLVIAEEVFTTLGMEDVVLHLNDRRILETFNSQQQVEKDATFLCQTLDKIDKIGQEKAFDLLAQRGYTTKMLRELEQLLTPYDNAEQKLHTLHTYYAQTGLATTPLEDLARILQYVRSFSESAYQSIKIDTSLARGMDYYTGAIFEIKLTGSSLGSFGGGGRYDNLLEAFGQPPLPSVGISFGMERIYDHLKIQGLFPTQAHYNPAVMLVPMERDIEHCCIQYLKQLHKQKIAAELYPAGKRMKHIFAYAHKKKIPWVAIIGSEEMAGDYMTIKNMATGAQKKCKLDDLMRLLTRS